jgi:phosphatidylethanolamine/phosphatidyl-N-methylethanolamine N-methyltransferase
MLNENAGHASEQGAATANGSREWLFFLRRWLSNPLRVGALLPSSRSVARLVARKLPDPDGQLVLELGAGTGAVTAALAERLPEEQLVLVEVDEDLCRWLRQRFPRAVAVCGDAFDLPRLLPEVCKPGRISTIVSGLPVLQFPVHTQRAFVEHCFSLTGRDGTLLQYSYSPRPPLACRTLGLDAVRLGQTIANLPPMFLWRFTKSA